MTNVALCFCVSVNFYVQNGGYIYIYIPGVPKKTIHCLISSNVKTIKAISIK